MLRQYQTSPAVCCLLLKSLLSQSLHVFYCILLLEGIFRKAGHPSSEKLWIQGTPGSLSIFFAMCNGWGSWVLWAESVVPPSCAYCRWPTSSCQTDFLYPKYIQNRFMILLQCLKRIFFFRIRLNFLHISC